MTNEKASNSTNNDRNGTSHRDAPPPRTTRLGTDRGFPFGYSPAPTQSPHFIAVAKLLVPRLRPETLPDFLLELGRNGLGFAYVDGEPAVFPIGGTDHSTLRSMGLLAAWTHGLYAWESGTDRDPEDGDLDSAMKAVDDLWSRHDPLGRSLTPGQLASVRKFLDLLPLDAVTEAVEIAARKIPEDDCLPDRFRYFCGVCWGMIRERRALRSSCN